MKTPKSLEITTHIGCPNQCKFCPQNILLQKYLQTNRPINMSLQTFKNCLSKLPGDVRIDFSGMCEPWINPHCTEMILWAYKHHFSIAVFTTTIGLTERNFQRIKKIPFSDFMVHLADSENNAQIPVTTEYQNFLMEIKDARISNIRYMTMGQLHPKLSPHFSNLLIKLPMISRAGNTSCINSPINHGPIICDTRQGLKHNVLLPSGEVILCCMDYSLRHILGNLLFQEYQDLFSGKEFRQILRKLQNEKLGDVICRHCEYAKPTITC